MDYDYSIFDQVARPQRGEDGVVAKFYDKVVKTEQLTDDGLPVFKTETYVEIRLKDNTTDIYDQKADDEKIRRFPIEYQRYVNSKKSVKEGSPLEQFAFLSGAEVETLKLRGIFTVEELANLDDQRAESIDMKEQRDLAKKVMKMASKTKNMIDFDKKEAEYIEEIEKCKNYIKELEAKIEKLQTKKTKKAQ